MPRGRKKNIQDQARESKNNQQPDASSSGWTHFLANDEKLDELGISEWKPESGENGEEKVNEIHLLDFSEEDPDVLAVGLFLHPDIGVDRLTFLCPRKMAEQFRDKGFDVPDEIADGKCPVCERHDGMLREYQDRYKGQNSDGEWLDERKALWNSMKALRPHAGGWRDENKPRRNLVWCVDVSSEESEDEGLRFFSMPNTVFDMLRDEIADFDETDKDDNPVEPEPYAAKGGHKIVFKRSGSGRDDVEYRSLRLKPYKFDLSEFAKQVPPVRELLVFHSYDDIADAMGGAGEKTEPDEAPRHRRRHPAEEPDEDPTTEEGHEQLKDEIAEAFEDTKDEAGEEKEGTGRRRRGREAEEDEGGNDRPRRRRRTEEPNPYEGNEDNEDENSSVSEIRRKVAERRRKRGQEEENERTESD